MNMLRISLIGLLAMSGQLMADFFLKRVAVNPGSGFLARIETSGNKQKPMPSLKSLVAATQQPFSPVTPNGLVCGNPWARWPEIGCLPIMIMPGETLEMQQGWVVPDFRDPEKNYLTLSVIAPGPFGIAKRTFFITCLNEFLYIIEVNNPADAPVGLTNNDKKKAGTFIEGLTQNKEDPFILQKNNTNANLAVTINGPDYKAGQITFEIIDQGN